MEGELVYRQYPASIEVSRTSKGLYSWVIKTRADTDDKRPEREKADEEVFERAVALDEKLSRSFDDGNSNGSTD